MAVDDWHLTCWLCLESEGPKYEAVTIYDGKSWCMIHFRSRRRADLTAHITDEVIAKRERGPV